MSISAIKKNKTFFEFGFTLIELLVVISIIGILATLVVANLNAARGRARDSVRKADLKNIMTSLRIYYNDNQGYPTTLTFGAPFTNSNTTYMNLVPNDPLYNSADASSPRYIYSPSADLESFTLSACLENSSDTTCKNITVTGLTCLSSCIYQVSP